MFCHTTSTSARHALLAAHLPVHPCTRTAPSRLHHRYSCQWHSGTMHAMWTFLSNTRSERSAGEAGTALRAWRPRLVRADDHALDARRAVQRRHGHQRDDSGAVGVGDDAAAARPHARHRARIDLWDHQRHALRHAERRAVIDDLHTHRSAKDRKVPLAMQPWTTEVRAVSRSMCRCPTEQQQQAHGPYITSFHLACWPVDTLWVSATEQCLCVQQCVTQAATLCRSHKCQTLPCISTAHHQRSGLWARTVQPASAASGANRFDMDPPALKSAMSTPLKLRSVSSSTVCCSPSQSMVLPADLRAQHPALSALTAANKPERASALLWLWYAVYVNRQVN